jgi:hypothetical protein
LGIVAKAHTREGEEKKKRGKGGKRGVWMSSAPSLPRVVKGKKIIA